MKKFKKLKALKQIRAQCRRDGVRFIDDHYEYGSDFVVLTSGKRDEDYAVVFYNTFNGWFFGTHPDGRKFSTASEGYENEDWYIALLNYFYEGVYDDTAQ